MIKITEVRIIFGGTVDQLPPNLNLTISLILILTRVTLTLVESDHFDPCKFKVATFSVKTF
jgi:hypothetical protein